MHHRVGRVVLLSLLAAPATALAYDEAVSGDLSSDPNTPTALAFVPGTNVVTGSVTSTAPTDTADYFTFTVPSGFRVEAIKQMAWSDVPGPGPGNRGYHAIIAGPTSLVPTAGNSLQFLGGHHMDQVASGTDLLTDLGGAGRQAGTGFGALGPGVYTYHVQQTGAQKSAYNLQFVLVEFRAVPALGRGTVLLAAALLMAIGAIVAARRVRRV